MTDGSTVSYKRSRCASESAILRAKGGEMREVLQAKMGLVAVGIGIGLLHLPISLALNVTLNGQGAMARSIVLLLYPMAVAVTGLGAVLAMRYPRLAQIGSLRVAGVALLSYLWLSLRYNFATEVEGQLAISAGLHFAATAVWYLFLGAAQTGMLSIVRKRDSDQLGMAWAWHLAGLFVGYVLSEGASEFFGVNAVLVSCGLALLITPKWSVPAGLALLLASLPLKVDTHIENYRVIEGELRAEIDHHTNRSKVPNITLDDPRTVGFDHLDWSRFGQFRVQNWSHNRIGILYNLKFQYNMPRNSKGPSEKRLRFRRAFYASFPKTDDIAIIATGGGRSLYFFDDQQLSRMMTVERDPSAARYFSETHTEANDGMYVKSNFINADGRAAMETSSRSFDTIVFESSLYQPTHTMLPMATPFFYLTEEAIDSYLDKLKPGGLIAFEVRTYTDRSRDRRDFLPYQILMHLIQRGLDARAIRCGKGRVLYILASTDEYRLSSGIAAIESAGYTEQSLRGKAKKDRMALTDDTPFANWNALQDKKKKLYLRISGGLAGLGLLIGLGMTTARRRKEEWTATPWFWTLGYFHAALQFHTFHLWRTYFGDSLKTVWWLIIINFAMGAVASIFANHLEDRLRARSVRMWGTAGLLGLHFLACWALPFHEPSEALRLAYGLVALVPSSILLGIWMPLGLRSASSDGLGNWLAADAIGTLVAACALFLVMIPLGGHAYGSTVVVSGLLIAAMWRPAQHAKHSEE